MRKWAMQVDTQRRAHREMAPSTSRPNETSSIQFHSLPDKASLMSIYRQEEEYGQNGFDDMSSV